MTQVRSYFVSYIRTFFFLNGHQSYLRGPYLCFCYSYNDKFGVNVYIFLVKESNKVGSKTRKQ